MALLTSIVTDWATNNYTRQSNFPGRKEKWREYKETYHYPSEGSKNRSRNYQGCDEKF